MKTKNNWSKSLKTPLVFITVVVITYLLTMLTGKNDFFLIEYLKNNFITLIITFIMIFVLLFDALRSRNKLNNISDTLENITNQIKQQQNIKTIAASCKNVFIQKGLYKFIADKNKFINNGIGVQPDIAEYINEQTISDITHREISNQISNAMTGLGILGTFLGLIVGLQNFNQNEIMSSTNQLIEGMKTAFYTSIFGVTASIIYNHFYYKDLETNNRKLEEFLNAFYSEIAANPEYDFYNKMIGHNSNEANLIADALTPCLATMITKSITPIMNKLNTSIDKYIMDAVTAQSSTLDKIVDNFMTRLNKSMDDQFHNLSYSIRDMCTWQNDFVEKSTSFLSKIDDIADTLSGLTSDIKETEKIRKEINDVTNNLIGQTKSYVDELKSYSAELKEFTNELKTETQHNAEHTKAVKELSELQTKEIAETVKRFEDIIEQFRKYTEDTERAIMSHRNDNSALLRSLEQMTDRVNAYQTENNKGLEKNAESLQRAIDNLVHFNNDLKSNVEFMSSQFAMLEQNVIDSRNHTQAFIETVSTMITDIRTETYNMSKKSK